MSLNPKWTPMRWRCGPLAVAQPESAGKEAARPSVATWSIANQWTEPQMLGLLEGTSINCLIVDWAAGGKEDQTQQWLLLPLIEAGRRKGISFIGRVTAKEGLPAIAAAGKAAGLEALLLSGPAPEGLDLPVVALYARDGVDWDHLTDIFAVNGNAWPGSLAHRHFGGRFPSPFAPQAMGAPHQQAGPTVAPWVDSNGWVSLLARGIAPGKTLWLEVEPKEPTELLAVAQYCLAVADARATGCRWVIDLDEPMRAGLAQRKPEIVAAWKQIAAMNAFFDQHPQWAEGSSVGVLTVVSDFRANAGLSNEVLNLLQRQHVPFVVADRTAGSLAARVTGQRGVLWVDDTEPTAEQHALLMQFVKQGGLLVAPKYWGPAGVASHQEDWLFDYNVYPVGKGQIVVATEGFTDPFTLARDMHIAVGHQNDPFRLYNPGLSNCFVGSLPGTHKRIVHVLNYSAPYPVEYLTLWVHERASAATLWSADNSKALKCHDDDGGTSFEIPPVEVYYAVEMERQA